MIQWRLKTWVTKLLNKLRKLQGNHYKSIFKKDCVKRDSNYKFLGRHYAVSEIYGKVIRLGSRFFS